MEYIEAFYNGLLNILPLSAAGQQAFGFMLVGIAIGFWVGILPGLGGAATLALMLPFIYKMDPTSAFAFLLGSNAVTATTGDITSILFGVPGEGTTASTIVDGHPMAKKGEAGRALGAALMSSLVGAIFGAFVLAAAIPIAAPLVLSIGSPEFFMLALLGITFVGSLSGGNIVKGLLAGGLGLMISTIGLDPIRGVPRFTFEGILGEGASIFLWDGVDLVSVTIGLFAIPEIIDLAVKGTSISREQVGKLGGVMEGVKDTFRHWWLVLRCSALGAYVGILPGVGGGTAQWVAYAYAVQSSPDKERFGKGAVEGVLGPGAANNSTRGGDLITTVAFGIPSSVSTAILFGAFLIQGIVPGPDMLNPAKHLALTFSFVWIIIVSNIITVAACFMFLNPLARITNIRGTLLIPFLLVLIYLGGFTVKNSFGDMIMVLIFGALGWLMVQFDWQRPPLLVGLVLGTITERNFWISTRAYGAGWLTHPGVLLIAVLIAGAIFYSIRQIVREKKRPRPAVAQPAAPELDVVMIKNPVYRPLFALFFVALFGYVLRETFYEIRPMEDRAALFPMVLGIPCLALAILAFGQEVFTILRREEGAALALRGASVESSVVRKRAFAIVAWIVGFFLAIWLLGFVIAVPVASFLYFRLAGGEKWSVSIPLSLTAGAIFYGLFDYFLHLPFPEGQLFSLMGN
ncbi:MAG TPA: tripartite tricarboxylate transporter permease [candidate division Zixibacteria bacterium]|nr:tripartite tricarboxylate transporter permease [candidate division Zixibacteria bacterium]